MPVSYLGVVVRVTGAQHEISIPSVCHEKHLSDLVVVVLSCYRGVVVQRCFCSCAPLTGKCLLLSSERGYVVDTITLLCLKGCESYPQVQSTRSYEIRLPIYPK